MYELMLTEQRLATYPRSLRELMHQDLIEALDLPWMYKNGPGIPLVIHQPHSVFSGHFEVDALYGTKSYLPAFLFDHQILNREETESMVRMVSKEVQEGDLEKVASKLMSCDIENFGRFSEMTTADELIKAIYHFFHNWGDMPKGHFYELFEDNEMDYKMCDFLPEHVKLRDQMLRISYLSVDFEDSGCHNMVSYFTDSYDAQLENAQAESDPHTTYRLVYEEYEKHHPYDGTDATCVLINPLRGGGFSCTN